jgi:1,2-phenylacetyl-CoA epoxidase catalytic subunit
MRRVPTIDDRVMRARISSNDMQQAVAFIDVALAARSPRRVP